METELVANLLEVVLRGALGDEQLRGDLAVGQTLGHKAGDLPFALGQADWCCLQGSDRMSGVGQIASSPAASAWPTFWHGSAGAPKATTGTQTRTSSGNSPGARRACAS